MEKIQLTQEQADAVEYLKGLYDGCDQKETNFRLISEKLDPNYKWENCKFNEANDITNSNFIALLHHGYEVIPQYNIGDWVVLKSSGKVYKIRELSNISNRDFVLDNDLMVTFRHIRHAALEEIQKEKKRRFWNKLGREEDGWKEGDVVADYHNVLTSINAIEIHDGEVGFPTHNDSYLRRVPISEIRLVTPVEQRLDK